MSKFDSIFTGKKAAQPDALAEAEKPKSPSVSRKIPDAAVAPDEAAFAEAQSVTVKRGRPNGKRSDPDYVGFTTYIRRDTHHEVKTALLREKQGRELSELVEELLSQWLKHDA